MNHLSYLYVEDDPLSREALTIVLKRVMKLDRVYVFENSQDFMSRIMTLPEVPDIILLDIHMEPYNGFEMLNMLRHDATYQDVLIIALTASVMNEEVELLKNSGFDSVIGKPINVANFPTILSQIADGEKIWHITD
ncbi:response regulator [Anaerolineales bacterium]